MTLQTIGNALLIVVLIGWIGFRQLTWRPVSIARMWRVPAIMAIVGVVLLVQATDATHLTALDFAVLLVEIAVSLGIGAWMGAIAVFRPLSGPREDPDAILHSSSVESRTGWWGLALWVLVIVIRIGIDVIAARAGSHLATSTGIIVLLVAANRAARTAVFAYRLDRMPAVAA
ncbi:hypothetical protein G3T36_01375 [Diaminobutyricibacter tongyongensis]|uniref:DUF1453 family protein n=1 Tax=Leifsonia tongyongensis TaxID=1268043 RepID=A0A6L9XSY2_9MICO|nr:hypothetical protein [Diaminobutyricibacter tongyongensis]NEN04512.1 hypothetical protein [Diaminobutyricibacter tongyongensis]